MLGKAKTREEHNILHPCIKLRIFWFIPSLCFKLIQCPLTTDHCPVTPGIPHKYGGPNITLKYIGKVKYHLSKTKWRLNKKCTTKNEPVFHYTYFQFIIFSSSSSFWWKGEFCFWKVNRRLLVLLCFMVDIMPISVCALNLWHTPS